MCECTHTYYMHGDRAVALCGGIIPGTEDFPGMKWAKGRQCTCKGFREVVVA